jgi:hypothetical protein
MERMLGMGECIFGGNGRFDWEMNGEKMNVEHRTSNIEHRMGGSEWDGWRRGVAHRVGVMKSE